MKETVLITGAGGFAGKHTVDHFLANSDYHIVGLDSFRHLGDSARLNAEPGMRNAESDSVRLRYFCHDLNAPVSHRLVERIGRVDYIINCAAISHVDTSIEDPVYVWENNALLIGNILQYARRQNDLKMFIQCSTDEVFGPAAPGQHHTEWGIVLPSNPYSASKAAQDALCISYWRTFDLPLVITHTMNLTGPGQDPEKYIPKIISRILQEREIEVHGTKQHPGSRKYLDVRNLADAWLALMKNRPARYFVDATLPDKYNIAGTEIDNLELVNLIATMMEIPAKVKFVDFHSARPGHDARYSLDSSKIEKTIGWFPKITLLESLRETIEFMIDHPEWREIVP